MTHTAPVGVADLVDRARQSIENFTSAQVESHLFDPTTLLVDLREPDEIRLQGRIAGAMPVPRGLLEFVADPTSPLHDRAFDPSRLTILYCSMGARSALAAATLRSMGWEQVGHLDGGFQRWAADGRPVAGLAAWHDH